MAETLAPIFHPCLPHQSLSCFPSDPKLIFRKQQGLLYKKVEVGGALSLARPVSASCQTVSLDEPFPLSKP